MIDVSFVGWDDPDAVALRAAMADEMSDVYRDASVHQNRDGAAEVDPATIEATVLVIEDGVPVGHGALRRLGTDLEIKRMFVLRDRRGAAIADRVLAELEEWARRAGEKRLILHTGERQTAAIGFYRRHGYTPIDVYPPYEELAYSLCFEKGLRPPD